MSFSRLLYCISLLSLGFGVANTASAEDHRERAHWHGDIHFFHEHDLAVWRKGHWFHGPHQGKPGWWWVVDGVWYFYEKKAAEIPDPYMPPTVTVQVQAAPPAIPPPPPAPVAPPPGTPPPPSNWYYCSNPHGYYPYVTTCPGGWTSVPATPPPSP